MDPTAMRVYAQLCGWTLARAHARSGDRVALAGYLGTDDKLDSAMVEFAEAYADQNAKDFAALQAAASAGRIEVAPKGW
jgi:sugar/nucleoside kinase (ribokinase family)